MVKGESRASTGSKVVLTREQRNERLRRLQRDRQARLEKLMNKEEEDEKKGKEAEKKEDLAAQSKRKAHHPKKGAYTISDSKNTSPSTANITQHLVKEKKLVSVGVGC